MVFTGDHLNSPPMIDQLEGKGVLTKDRAADLRYMPLQECDLLLHESGAPPIHTPLSVLEQLPERVKDRLYVVHTSALPKGCKLRVAPTGTAGTIRLDSLAPHEIPRDRYNEFPLPSLSSHSFNQSFSPTKPPNQNLVLLQKEDCIDENDVPDLERKNSMSLVDALSREDSVPRLVTAGGNNRSMARRDSLKKKRIPPLVFLRPTDVSDAWFILNLLSAVPFLSSLSYANTMEVLETAQVEMFCPNEVVIPAHRRKELLCVVWEGTCIERDASMSSSNLDIEASFNDDPFFDSAEESWARLHPSQHDFYESDGGLQNHQPAVWHAGDWSGPLSLQPDGNLSAENSDGPKDVVALSAEGVKVIMVSMKDLHHILKSGSKLYRKYLMAKEKQAAEEEAMKALMIRNEALAAEQQTQNGCGPNYGMESIPEQQTYQWFVHDNLLEVLRFNSALGKLNASQKRHLESLAEGPRLFDPGTCLWQVGDPVDFAFLIVSGTAGFISQSQRTTQFGSRRGSTGSMQTASDRPHIRIENVEEDKQLFNVSPSSEYARLEIGLQLRVEELDMEIYDHAKDAVMAREEIQRNARDRFANKVLGRLYARKAYTAGLIFSRGHFLSDTSRMVSGSLAHLRADSLEEGGQLKREPEHHCHSSNMAAGPDGCVVMVFPRNSMIAFLDANPGVLLTLLGTQVVV
eukprot:CAMPEP_0118677008 /NCGR_PEP_ID=MMETSP0800-20121206/2376_1 /TAXON_ID=210618 ORGANISM="Striatella unipunctata, Strain CCMP2910" /NCGR_SAMPLE_ID=MMETSP0800 /ASSEMBLY_ACC=CAM_ASM_000638 /LENGTH=687 /DNA_ID=CAMNT_0006572609 /DNA_START=186 /DNA_END=2249 /DNA_ORIENTATION=-